MAGRGAGREATLGLGVSVFFSVLSAGYVAALAVGGASVAAEPEAAPAGVQTGGGAAEWVRGGKPVPSEALYDPRHPAPEQHAKPRSWHNRLLFPTVVCPYCGRRVPTKQGSYAFLAVGLLGQAVFSARFILQWMASERAKRSVVPESFWWLSIAGSALLLAYAISIKAVPIVLGQVPGFFIYARNLQLLRARAG